MGLSTYGRDFEHDGIRFVAFDVSPRRLPMYGELVEFIAMLEADSP